MKSKSRKFENSNATQKSSASGLSGCFRFDFGTLDTIGNRFIVGATLFIYIYIAFHLFYKKRIVIATKQHENEFES